MKKKLVLVVTAVLMAAALAIGGSLAYFTDTQTAKNTFTVGNVKINLTEPGWCWDGIKDSPAVYPGEALTKDPQVTNTGANPSFVRIKVSGLDQFGDVGMIEYRTNYVVGALGEGWVDGGDGYFYYTKVLERGKTTTALFDSIVMPTGLTNGNPLIIRSVDVLAQAVQAQGAKPSYADVQNMTVPEIAAWFATCGM